MKNISNLKRNLKMEYSLYVFLIPGVIVTLLFAYLPMFINIIAFMDYQPTKGFLGLASPFVGFANFSKFLNDSEFYKLMWRTFLYSAVNLVFSFPAPLLLALMFNELRNATFKRISQTITYLPHFVSWTTIAGLVYIFLSVDTYGIINDVKQLIFGGDRVLFLQKPELLLPLIVITSVWQGAGWGSILYLAAIAAIDPGLYDSAKIDGATRMQQIRYITLPGIMPTTIILLIFSIGGLFSVNFEQVFSLQNSVTRPDTHVINTYVYFKGIVNRDYSFSTAIGLFQGLIVFVLMWSTNFLSKKFNQTSLF